MFPKGGRREERELRGVESSGSAPSVHHLKIRLVGVE